MAAFLGRRGHEVALYERRGDPHAGNLVGGRSINLALSTRGIHALQLETAQSCYMDESPPYPWDAKRAALLSTLLKRLVEALLATHPGH